VKYIIVNESIEVQGIYCKEADKYVTIELSF